MNILGRHVLFWRKPGVEASRFATVLPRIRAIREECGWQPLTNASAAEQRRERVQDARRRIIYHPVPYDRALEWRLPLRRTWWLWLAVALAVLCAVAMIWAWTVADPSRLNLSHQFNYQLPVAPQFLSEDLALTWAKESLAKVVNDASNWKPVALRGSAAGFAPDGIRETYLMRDHGTNLNQGILLFESTRTTNESWLVTLVLNSNQLECTVSRKRY